MMFSRCICHAFFSFYTEERNHFPFFGRTAAGREAAISLYGGVCILAILENGISFRFSV
jgi:hypothetical protein